MTEQPQILSAKAGLPLSPDYGLARHSRGSWRFQTTVIHDPRLCGERLTIPLGTRDKAEARRRRDEQLVLMHRAGIRLAKPIILASRAGINS